MLDCWDNKGELKTGYMFGSLHGNLSTLDNWQLVRQPVTWQEAIEAWADGKTIKTQSDDGIRTYRKTSKGLQSVLGGVTKDELLNGTWYVED